MTAVPPPDQPERRIAVVRDYDGLMAAVHQRVDELKLTCSLIDELASLPTGYAGKILGPARVKTLGPVSLGLILGVLGLKLHVVEDTEAVAKLSSRYTARDEKRRRAGLIKKPMSPEARDKIGRVQAADWGRAGGAMPKASGMSSARARKMARYRWKDHKVPRWKRKQLARRAERERLRRARLKEAARDDSQNKEERHMTAEVAKRGLFDMQLCVPDDWDDDAVKRFADEQNACGTEYGWSIRRGRVPCASRAGHVHIMLDA